MRIHNILKISAFSAAMFVAGMGPSQATNLVQNGGFETGDFTDWSLSGNLGYTNVGNNPNAAHTGSYAAQLGAVGSDDFMSQTLSTTAGTNYTLSFWHIYSSGAGPTGDFAVQWNGSDVFGPVASTNPPSPLVWTEYSVSLTGTGSDTLTFVSRNDPSYQGLDDISLSVSVGGVPETSTWIMMMLGFAGLGFASYRASRKGVALT